MGISLLHIFVQLKSDNHVGYYDVPTIPVLPIKYNICVCVDI